MPFLAENKTKKKIKWPTNGHIGLKANKIEIQKQSHKEHAYTIRSHFQSKPENNLMS